MKIARSSTAGRRATSRAAGRAQPQGRRVLPPDPRAAADHAKIAAFGSTRRARRPLRGRRRHPRAGRGRDAGGDPGRQELDAARGRGPARPRSTENLRMIGESVAYFKRLGREVIYDAEHFFDGYRPTRRTRSRRSRPRPRRAPTASCCATPTAATLPGRRRRASRRGARARSTTPARHPHARRRRLAVAQRARPPSAPARAGAGHDQRLRRALRQRRPVPLIADLELKLGSACRCPRRLLRRLTELSHFVAEVANLTPTARALRRAGARSRTRAASTSRPSPSWPRATSTSTRRGRQRDARGGERALRAAEPAHRAEALGLEAGSARVAQVLQRIKELEHRGFQFEAAEARSRC